MKFRLLLFSLIALQIACSMEIQYSGQVINKNNKNPIADVRIELYGKNFEETRSDTNGYYSISGIQKTDYVNNTWLDIYFIKTGYKTVSISCGDDAGDDRCEGNGNTENLIIEMTPE